MTQKKSNLATENSKRVEEIKRLIVIAMFSDDWLLERLVLKGGNALSLIHQISTRSSRDIDFSIEGEFKIDEIDEISRRMKSSLEQTFGEADLTVFDWKMEEVPEGLTPDVADFWGGYGIEFKVIERMKARELDGDVAKMRHNAIALSLGGTVKFSIDISKFEYIAGKKAQVFDGYRIFTYSAEMIACEKLRAICQQMPEYGPVVKRNRPGAARARDFLDIYTLVTERDVDLSSGENQTLLSNIFSAKKVPLEFLSRIVQYREFHAADFPAVMDTVKPGVALQSFDFYFDFVQELVSKLGYGPTSG